MNVNIKLSVDLFPCISQIIGLMVCMGMIRGMNMNYFPCLSCPLVFNIVFFVRMLELCPFFLICILI